MRWTLGQDFFVGTNLPWLRYGGDFGANAWHPDGGVSRPAKLQALRTALDQLTSEGIAVVRWFMLCDGRAGLRESPSGRPACLLDCVFRDADAAVEELERAGLKAIFVLFDSHWFRPAEIVEGVQTCGRGRLAADHGLRSGLLEHVISPLLERYGRHPVIAAWDIVNEPEWVVREDSVAEPDDRIPRSAMRALIRDTVTLIHDRTSHAATVGSASTRTLSLVKGLDLDVYQAHWYDHLDRHAPLGRSVPALGLDRPLILGEFPTRGSARPAADILATARQAGYAGALSWSMLASDSASDHDAFVGELERFHAP